MKILIAFFFLTPLTFLPPPSHSGLCGIVPEKAYSQNLFGKNVGYYVRLKNNTSKKVDAVAWVAKFYNNFDDFKGEKTGKWESGNFTSEAEPGEIFTDLESAWISGASKVYIQIKRVHFTDGSSCGN